jgi:hypothetical protein
VRDEQPEEARGRHEVGIVGGDGLREPDRLKDRPFELRPQRERAIEMAGASEQAGFAARMDFLGKAQQLRLTA